MVKQWSAQGSAGTHGEPKTKKESASSKGWSKGGNSYEQRLALVQALGSLLTASIAGAKPSRWQSNGGGWKAQSDFSRTMDAINKVPVSKKAYVTGLPAGVTWKELQKHCEDNGFKPKFAEVFRQSNGVITFESEETTSAAIIGLNGSELKEKSITVEVFEQKQTEQKPKQNFWAAMNTLNKVPAEKKAYVNGIPDGVGWEELQQHCEFLGHKPKIAEVFKKGNGVISFETEEATSAAILKLNESELNGKAITVEAWTAKQKAETPASSLWGVVK